MGYTAVGRDRYASDPALMGLERPLDFTSTDILYWVI